MHAAFRPAEHPAQPASAGRVLVVDDSDEVRGLLGAALSAAGHAVDTAADLAGARALLARDDVDVVVLDLLLPDGEGIELLGAEGPRVIMITGAAHPELVAAALQAGAHDFVVKPVDAVEMVARVSAAIRSKRTADDLRTANTRLALEARTDVLTGLGNRRFVRGELERMIALAARHRRELAVLMVDVDHFKALNDVFGHATGDRVLAHMAVLLGRSLRATDVLARWGGEEFVAALPETGGAGARVLAERMRADAGERRDDIPPVTVSIGCAAWHGEDADALIARADAALYEAKRTGRDRVVLDDDAAAAS